MSRLKSKKPESSDALADAGQSSKEEIGKFLALTCRSVKYSDFLDAHPPLSVPVFQELQTVALIDQFFQLDDAGVCARLEMELPTLQNLRGNPHYAAMKQALLDAAKRLGGANTVDGLAEVMEREVAHEAYGLGMLEGTARDKQKALDAFIDRRSAKKTRAPEAGNALMIPERMLELMALGLEKEKHLQPRQIGAGAVIDLTAEVEDDSISADVLNVPAVEEDE